MVNGLWWLNKSDGILLSKLLSIGYRYCIPTCVYVDICISYTLLKLKECTECMNRSFLLSFFSYLFHTMNTGWIHCHWLHYIQKYTPHSLKTHNIKNTKHMRKVTGSLKVQRKKKKKKWFSDDDHDHLFFFIFFFIYFVQIYRYSFPSFP